MPSYKIFVLLACASIAAAPCSAQAQAEPASADIPVPGAESLDPPTVGVSATDEDASALSDFELTTLRGGESLIVSNQTLTAITSGNVINGNYTAGNVALSNQALSSFNGVGNLLINTGGQVSLQTGMNLTINVGD